MSSTQERFTAAFQSVMAQELDRRIILELLRANREVRYEELRKAVGEAAKQTFSAAIDRLEHHALVNRRLVAQGERYASYLSPSTRGTTIARVWENLATKSEVPKDLPQNIVVAIRRVFAGEPLAH